MGCDIHLHIEVRLNGKWEHYAAPNIDRDYSLFSRMAGVRGKEIPISKPKGLPSDLTTLTKYDADRCGIDGHDHSWLSKKEIVRLKDWIDGQRTQMNDFFDLEHTILHCYLFGNSFAGIELYPNERPDGVDDVRFVFWFDN